jgi:putative ABC transport system permease protein
VTEDQEAEIHALFNQNFDRYGYRLVPITETYFSGVSGDDKGNPSMLFVLELACLLMLVVAAINFLNFTLAESPMRVKSINTRRVLGEGLGRLRCSLVGESIVLSLLACCLALGLCAVVAQEPTELLVGELGLTEHWGLVALMLGLAVLLGVAAGAYPAWFVTSFQPALALKGSFGLTPKGRQLRSVLVSLQLVVAIFMVCYIGILLLQSRYIYNSDYGFAKDEVLYAQLSEELWGKKPAIRAELMQLGGVSDVSFSRFVLGSQDGYMSWGRGDDDHRITFTCMPVDWHYLRTMGIRVTAGRDFNEHDGDCYIINEAARRQWPWVEIDKKLLSNDYPVVGICEDVRFTSTRKDRSQEPMAFFIFGEKVNWGDQLGIVNIRVAAGVDKVAMRQQVRKLLTDMGSGEEIGVNFLDSQLENLYQEEFRFIRQVIAFSVVCLLITLIGVFCLTLFETEYRRKEIGIRKIMGSSVGQVLLLLARRYVWLLGAAFVIAVPLAWHFGSVWLQNFAERTPIYWWLFPLAMLVVALLTLATVVLQSWRTALENPINTIKTE